MGEQGRLGIHCVHIIIKQQNTQIHTKALKKLKTNTLKTCKPVFFFQKRKLATTTKQNRHTSINNSHKIIISESPQCQNKVITTTKNHIKRGSDTGVSPAKTTNNKNKYFDK